MKTVEDNKLEIAKAIIYGAVNYPQYELPLEVLGETLEIGVPELRKMAVELGLLGGTALLPSIKAGAVPLLCKIVISAGTKRVLDLLWKASRLHQQGKLGEATALLTPEFLLNQECI